MWASITSSSGWRTTAAALCLLRSGKYNTSQPLDLDEIKRDLEVPHNWRLQLWTTVTVLFLLIKLLVVRGAPLFTVLGLSYTLSWLAVQTLLLLTYRNSFTNAELSEIAHHFQGFADASLGPWWALFYIVPGVLQTSFSSLAFVFGAFTGLIRGDMYCLSSNFLALASVYPWDGGPTTRRSLLAAKTRSAPLSE
jgi:hypothetical protein